LEFAFERVVECMFNYMTDLSHVDIDPDEAIELSVEGRWLHARPGKVAWREIEPFCFWFPAGHDNMSLLFNLLDEFLFTFCTEYFICKRAEIVSFDREKFKLTMRGYAQRRAHLRIM
jgi:SHS2 domain-containing protein